MKNIKYFFQFIIIIIFFIFFKILGPNISSAISGKIFELIGPLFRSKKLIHSNIRKAFPDIDYNGLNKINKMMWNNYGRVFAEYVFIKDFRKGKLESKIEIEGKEVLEEIIRCKSQVIFVSGHLSNFELMALYLEKTGINLSAIYRPLNNIYLNKIMEKIRLKYICKHQIKKGVGGLKELIKLNKEGFSTALMIDQRVSQGIKSNFFNQKAYTTTIPAQLIKKFGMQVVPIFIERFDGIKFKMTVHKPLSFEENESIEGITFKLNKILEQMILKNPNYWIWSHNRWK